MIATMRLVLFVLFWVGVFTAVREWLYVRKHRLPLTRAEKLYPAIGLALVVTTLAVLTLVGISSQTVAAGIVLALAGILNLWAMQRRLKRTTRGVRKAQPPK